MIRWGVSTQEKTWDNSRHPLQIGASKLTAHTKDTYSATACPRSGSQLPQAMTVARAGAASNELSRRNLQNNHSQSPAKAMLSCTKHSGLTKQKQLALSRHKAAVPRYETQPTGAHPIDPNKANRSPINPTKAWCMAIGLDVLLAAHGSARTSSTWLR